MFEAVAEWLGSNVAGLDYSLAAGGNVFVLRMPDTPDNAVCVYPSPAGEPDAKLPYDPVEFQVVVRGDPDGTWAMATGRAIYSALHGLRNTTLPGGVYAAWILGSTGAGSPTSLGDDGSGRVQLAWDYRGEQLNTTEERP